MENLYTVLITSVFTFLASGGLWAFLEKRGTRQTATKKLLMGIARDKIMDAGLEHIRSGYISRDDFDELHQYFYEPYKSLGGNGTAEVIMNRIQALPFQSQNKFDVAVENNKEHDGGR